MSTSDGLLIYLCISFVIQFQLFMSELPPIQIMGIAFFWPILFPVAATVGAIRVVRNIIK